MSTHTPGPWVYEGSAEIEAEGCVTVARLWDEYGDYYDNADANGRLMAAAPDLLAACQFWDQGFTDGESWDYAQFLDWVNRNRAAARAAIAKATGEEVAG